MEKLHSMDDKRITKTKRNLKNTLKKLLRRKPFAAITVTELCKDADTSRITFYSHYNGKYDLADELVHDLFNEVSTTLEQLQRQNNPAGDPVLSAENMLNAILTCFESNREFFSRLNIKDSPYLFYAFHARILDAVEARLSQTLRTQPDEVHRDAVFLCAGLWNYISEGIRQSCPISTLREKSIALVRSMLSVFQTCANMNEPENPPERKRSD